MASTKKPAKPRQISKKPAKPVVICTNSDAIEATISALRNAGRLEAVDTARVEIARQLARSVDEHLDNASLWREYRNAENALRESFDEEPDALTELFKQFDGAVRDGGNPGA